jgi:glycine hydroxymethyltransferase
MPRSLAHRPWVPAPSEDLVAAVAEETAAGHDVYGTIVGLAEENRRIHDVESVNLNPASNVMNPKAEALLAAGLGTRASLGYPGDKYEMGLEAVERIEIIAAELAAEVFDAPFAEVRVGSGALSNLYAFMAACRPGDTLIAPSPAIGGHVTHHGDGAAGLYGLTTVPAPLDADRYTVDVAALRDLARDVRPKLITIGGSLNLRPHPVADIRAVADEVGAKVLFDAAHLCGMIAGGAWPNPLAEGAHLMTMSTYKSLGGPPGGLIVTTDAGLAERIDAIAYPGLTANFDPGRVAALAVALLDWKVAGREYAAAMVATATRLADELRGRGVPVHGTTRSHQFAIEAPEGGQRTARRLRRSHVLTCGIGLPTAPVDGDVNGLRIGTPEIVRRGMAPDDMPVLADLLARALGGEDVGPEVTAWRSAFTSVLFTA